MSKPLPGRVHLSDFHPDNAALDFGLRIAIVLLRLRIDQDKADRDSRLWAAVRHETRWTNNGSAREKLRS